MPRAVALCDRKGCQFSFRCARHKDGGAVAQSGDVWGAFVPQFNPYQAGYEGPPLGTRGRIVMQEYCRYFIENDNRKPA